MSTRQQWSTVDPDTFRRACSRFATGIGVATVAAADGTPYGLTVNSFTSVSCCPPLILVCIDNRCAILPHFRASSFFGVNVLGQEQRNLSVRFSRPEADRFEGVKWHAGDSGAPLIDGVLAAMECRVSQTVEAGDHLILIAEVVKAEYRDGRPLLYYRSAYERLA